MVGVGSSVSIVSHDGVSGANISIAEFVATHMTEESTADSYVFDRDHFFGSHAPELLAKLVVPRYLSTAISADAVHTYLTMGPAGSGVQMHMHGAGWNLQLHGSKQWFLSDTPSLRSWSIEALTKCCRCLWWLTSMRCYQGSPRRIAHRLAYALRETLYIYRMAGSTEH